MSMLDEVLVLRSGVFPTRNNGAVSIGNEMAAQYKNNAQQIQTRDFSIHLTALQKKMVGGNVDRVRVRGR